MITYICKNKDAKGEKLPCTNYHCETSVCPSCGGRAEAFSKIFWCKQCQVPIYEEYCACCGEKAKRMTTDLRPVFPEERLLLEIILGEPFSFQKDSVWNGSGNHYFVNGKRLAFSVKELKNMDAEAIRQKYDEYKEKNSYEYFEQYIKQFVKCNKDRYEKLVEEATTYIRTVSEGFGTTDIFVSFSGGKDSTVTADLVTRAFSNSQIMHIFGDTTLEFPFTYEYVERFKKNHPKTPVISARNKEKDFEETLITLGIHAQDENIISKDDTELRNFLHERYRDLCASLTKEFTSYLGSNSLKKIGDLYHKSKSKDF